MLIRFDVQAQGEQLARSIFPETTIVRPAPMFGFEDRLLHKLAGVTNLLTSNHMQERYWPVHVRSSRGTERLISTFPNPLLFLIRLSMSAMRLRKCY
jgi:hypothetical protein